MTTADDTAENTAQGPLTGTVKWFDPTKGFGFVVCEDDGPDVLLHANVLRNFGQGSVADGSGITLMVQRSERGLQAVDVLDIQPPEIDGLIGDLKHSFDIEADDIGALEVFPARVKWFDKAKGFGFANVFGDNTDVFVQIEILRRSGLSDLQAGEAIGLRMAEGKRGQMAVEIVGWETIKK